MAKLLLLDDVGTEKPSEHAREMYFYILDERCKEGLPVVITTNLPFEGSPSLVELMGDKAADRLFGMTGGKIVELRERSYRQLKSQP